MARVTKKYAAKHEAFAREYVIDLNAKQAAIRSGYSAKSAEQQGATLLSYPKVQARVQELLNKKMIRNEIKADDVLTRLDQIGGIDPALAYDENNCLKNIHDIPLEVRKCIKSIKVREEFDSKGIKTGEVIDVTWWDKIKANELIGKNQGKFAEQLRISDERTLSDIIVESNGSISNESRGQASLTDGNSRDAGPQVPVRKAIQGKRE